MLLNKRKIFLFSAVAAAVFISVLLILNIVKIRSLEENINKYTNVMIEESSESREKSDYLNSLSSMLAYDLNTTRASLGLPLKNYKIKNFDEDENRNNSQNSDIQLINGVNALLEAELSLQKSLKIGLFIENEIIAGTIETYNLETYKHTNCIFRLKYNGSDLIEITSPDSDTINLKSYDNSEINIKTASNEAVFFIKDNLENYKRFEKDRLEKLNELNALASDQNLKDAAYQKMKITFDSDEIIFENLKNSSSLKAYLTTAENQSFFKLSGNESTFSNISVLKNEIIRLIDTADMRTDEQIELDDKKDALEERLSNEDFLNYLSGLELSVNLKPRDEIDYFYYDLYHNDAAGKKLGSFAFLKKLGDIYLLDADDVPVSSLRTLSVKEKLEKNINDFIIPENIPEIEGQYSNTDSVTFLLVGNHEKNTDTMILVHADKKTKKAHLIGIPRDLYWKSRKINSIYLTYGAEQFKKELSDITGLKITNYIVVDMYAFIDIVNILGGIEVTLEEDLIDPTYKIRENGEWGTLNYSKGTYNLNGVEALRVARSRHGSNDFNRSERQQIIIKSLFDKIQQLHINDINKVYGMIDAMFEYIETDFSLIDILNLYNEFSDVAIDGKHVLSFDNILYDTYSNIYMLDEEEIEILDSDFNKGAWILFPRNNDWNNIRWYIRGIINGEIE